MCVNDIWGEYANEYGLIDKKQLKAFIKNLVSETTMEGTRNKFTDRDFEECHRKLLDNGRNGMYSK